MRAWRVTQGAVDGVLGVGSRLRAMARATGEPCMAGAVLNGPAVLLGAVQRAGAVVDLAACRVAGVTLWHRDTTGTAAWVGERAVWWSLALPHVASLVPDATARTVLNRNVRGVLRGLTRCGASAAYLGREWLAIAHRPGALLGVEQDADGVVQIDMVAGWDQPMALPDGLMASRERTTERWQGKVPVALSQYVGNRTPEAVVETVMAAVAAHAGVSLAWQPGVPEAVHDASPRRPVTAITDPWGHTHGAREASVAVPIGWVDAAWDGGNGWLGGDVLAGTHALRALALGRPWPGGVLEGAVEADLVQALALARTPPPAVSP